MIPNLFHGIVLSSLKTWFHWKHITKKTTLYFTDFFSLYKKLKLYILKVLWTKMRIFWKFLLVKVGSFVRWHLHCYICCYSLIIHLNLLKMTFGPSPITNVSEKWGNFVLPRHSRKVFKLWLWWKIDRFYMHVATYSNRIG